MSLAQEGYLFKRGGPPKLAAEFTCVRARAVYLFSFLISQRGNCWQCATYTMTGRS